MTHHEHDKRADDPQTVDPTLAEAEPGEEDAGGLVGGGGPAATIEGDDLGAEGEGLADADHGV